MPKIYIELLLEPAMILIVVTKSIDAIPKVHQVPTVNKLILIAIPSLPVYLTR